MFYKNALHKNHHRKRIESEFFAESISTLASGIEETICTQLEARKELDIRRQQILDEPKLSLAR